MVVSPVQTRNTNTGVARRNGQQVVQWKGRKGFVSTYSTPSWCFTHTCLVSSLLHSAINVRIGTQEDRQLLTGTHTVCLPSSTPIPTHNLLLPGSGCLLHLVFRAPWLDLSQGLTPSLTYSPMDSPLRPGLRILPEVQRRRVSFVLHPTRLNEMNCASRTRRKIPPRAGEDLQGQRLGITRSLLIKLNIRVMK